MSLGFSAERAGDTDPLALTARELVGEAVSVLGAQAHCAEELPDTPLTFAAPVEAMNAERLGDDLANGHPRVQRRVRVLEDDLDVTSYGPHLSALVCGDVRPVENDPPGSRLDQLDERASKGRLPAAGLAHDPERLAALDGEVDAVDGAHLANRVLEDPRLDRKVLDEPFDAQERVARGCEAGVASVTTWVSVTRAPRRLRRRDARRAHRRSGRRSGALRPRRISAAPECPSCTLRAPVSARSAGGRRSLAVD